MIDPITGKEQKATKAVDFLESLLNNQRLLRNARTILSVVVSIGVPILYFGLSGNIDWESIVNFQFGMLSAITLFSIWNTRIDFASRAFEDECKANEDITKVEKDINNVKSKITMDDHPLGNLWAAGFNKSERKRIAQARAQDRIDKIQSKMELLAVRGKTLSKRHQLLQKKLAKLKDKGVRVWRFKPIRYAKVYDFHSKASKTEVNPASRISYNPKWDGWAGSLLGTVVKSFGIGGAGSIAFLIGAPLKTIIAYYVFLFISITLTIVTVYANVRLKTRVKYLEARQNKLKMLESCYKFMEDEKKKPVVSHEVVYEVEDVETMILPKLNFQEKIQHQPVLSGIHSSPTPIVRA